VRAQDGDHQRSEAADHGEGVGAVTPVIDGPSRGPPRFGHALSEAVPRVLIVDDDPILARVVSRYLGRHGLTTEWVSNGEAAAAAVEAQRPDVVLLDVMLPGPDGHQVCRELRARWDLHFLGSEMTHPW